MLPRVLRRLVHATVARVERIGFPAEEGVQLGGWDGIVRVQTGNAFVPDGDSVWELGSNRNVKGKADGEYRKRSLNPLGVKPAETTFVFVTPRRWRDKDKWANDRRAENLWRDVRAYDADGLASWLELALGVHIWLSTLLGKRPEGVGDLTDFWLDWSGATDPPFSPGLVISGRTTEANRLREWLRGAPSSITARAESREDALAFFTAALHQLPAEERVAYLARAVVVRDRAAWQQLTASDGSLILIPMFDEREGASRVVGQGHHVLIPMGKDETESASVMIPRLHREGAKDAMTAMGLPNGRAEELATLARRSMRALRRKLALNPEVQRPAWAKPAEARALIPILLAGKWNDANTADREVVAKLARTTYDEVTRTLVRWANEPDAPVLRVGDTWLLASKEDAWVLLSRFVTRDDLDGLESMALEVLGGADPSFDLPADRRWMANVLGKSLPYSGLLREGLAETLAVMAARGETAHFADAASGQERAARVVRRLLDKANKDWRVWASIDHHLRLIAEAAPREFLDAVEKGLSGERPVLLNLFSEGEHSLFGSSPHTGLLWALELLAWHPDYLGHAALLLAKLARLDPGGKLLNRPHRSLRDIFLCWFPQTTANLSQRLRVLDTIRAREPRVAWGILCTLLPESHSTAHPTPKPRWREWVSDADPQITYAELWEAAREVVTRLLEDVGTDGRRWCNLIASVDDLPKEPHDAIVERLMNAELPGFTTADRVMITDALREVISRHREFPDADWAMPKEFVDRLQGVYERFEPDDPILRRAHLFATTPRLLEPPSPRDWHARHDSLEEARFEAVISLYGEGGLDMLLDMASRVERPEEVGAALGRSALLSGDEEDDLIGRTLTSSENSLKAFARGFVIGRWRTRGLEWAEAKLSGEAGAGWSAEQRAEFYTCLPFLSCTWDQVETESDETQRLYWARTSYGYPEGADCERAVAKLIENDRPYAAVEILSFQERRHNSTPSARVIIQAIESSLRATPDVRTDWQFIAHNMSELLNVLEGSGEVSDEQLAALEWSSLPLTEHYRRPKMLHRELSRNPDFFVEVMTLVYKAEDEEARDLSEEDTARAKYGRKLLDSWHGVPGKGEDGSLDGAVLKDWITRAREALGARGRGGIGDYSIGRILRYSPNDADGTWPHSAVCDLIEELANESVERGFETEVFNSRGVTMRGQTDGGAQERQLAESYREQARRVCDRSPRTAAMLHRLTDLYSSHARREDVNAELTEDLWR
jgi:hypothetical protein